MRPEICVPRRQFLTFCASALSVGGALGIGASAQLSPFTLSLRRDRNLASTLGLNDCVLGRLYIGAGSLSDPGTLVCDTLELPFRNELKEISCIKPGSYSGFVRTGPTDDGRDLGWRLQLEKTTQIAIQLHTGNTTDNTRGCVLVGNRADSGCELKGGTSRPARDKIRALYGDDEKRSFRLVVMN